MPEYYSTVMSWFGEDLIVPETNRALEQLGSGHVERRVPKNVVKTWSYPPGAQRVKKHLLGIGRLIGMKLVEQVVTAVGRVDQLS